jgi:diguanylate cyclase (GGDEF)-like protein
VIPSPRPQGGASRASSAFDAAATGLLLDCVEDAIVVLDSRMAVRYANQTAIELAGGPGAPLLSEGEVSTIIHLDDFEQALATFRLAVDGERAVTRLRLVLPSGERLVEVTLTNHLATPAIEGIVACFRNLDQEQALRASMLRQQQLAEHVQTALTDELTGLPNRRLLLERLDAVLSGRPGPVAVYFVDLDDFKAINDSLGHTAGDAMLRSTTQRLLNVYGFREQWGRLGGDEFVLFRGCDDHDPERLAHSLRDSLRQPIVLGGRPCYTTASVGLAVVDADAGAPITAAEAVRRADIAMFEGKRAGRGSVTMFRPEMEQRVVVRAELEGQLRRSLTGSGPHMVLQPIVDLTTGATVAVEALARWHSPTQGPIGPDRFIPMAEHMGVIDQLDRHVLRKACRDVANLRDPFTGMMLQANVNISTVHLGAPDFAANVLRIVEAAQFDPARLVLEVTESIGVQYDAALGGQLATLRAEGVRLALDDFGTGHSSLAQLETLAVDYLKVDRSFLSGLDTSSRRLRFIETIVDMANVLELDVVFEGIEHELQAQALLGLGVRLGQGYLLAHPTRTEHLGVQFQAARATVDGLHGSI